MFIPDIAYQFTSKDLTSVFAEILHRGEQVSSTVNSITISLTGIPQDRMLMLSNIAADGVPGATQAVTMILMEVVTHTGLQSALARDRFAGTADLGRTLNWQGQIYVLGQGAGNASALVQVVFDASVNSNTARAAFSGVVVPRGNIAVF